MSLNKGKTPIQRKGKRRMEQRTFFDSHCHISIDGFYTSTKIPQENEQTQQHHRQAASKCSCCPEAEEVETRWMSQEQRSCAFGDKSHERLCERVEAVKRSPCCLCGTSPSVDWGLIARAAAIATATTASSSCCLVPGFGLHPWWLPDLMLKAERTEDDDADKGGAVMSLDESKITALLQTMEKLLAAYPQAIVGEIGLDKMRRGIPSMDVQVDVFERQMRVAAAFNRPVSVHCVRAYGPMLDVLRHAKVGENFPPAVIFHGFSGSPDFVKSLLKLPKAKARCFFFGFGAETTMKLASFDKLLDVIPADRILIESDSFCMKEAGALLATISDALRVGFQHGSAENDGDNNPKEASELAFQNALNVFCVRKTK